MKCLFMSWKLLELVKPSVEQFIAAWFLSVSML